MTDTFLTQIEAADVLRISARTLERKRIDSTGPKFVKAGRRVLYSETALKEWTDARTFQNTSEADAAA